MQVLRKMHRIFLEGQHSAFAFLFTACLFTQTLGIGEVIWAVNCGGESHTDIHGIRYSKDSNQAGIASDYGKSLMIQRVVPQDQILYQTERYDVRTFGYQFPVKQDGDYVLVLKFSEVWFTVPNGKVFDIMVNGEHTVVEGLDIFSKVGRGTAHDEIIPFSVRNGKMRVGSETSYISNQKVSVEFIKGDKDNPKINAVYVMKGTMEDVPQLPPLPVMGERFPPEEDEDEEEDEEAKARREKKVRNPSGPKVQDPYATEDTGTMMLPIVVAIGAFIPLVFCLCKL